MTYEGYKSELKSNTKVWTKARAIMRDEGGRKLLGHIYSVYRSCGEGADMEFTVEGASKATGIPHDKVSNYFNAMSEIGVGILANLCPAAYVPGKDFRMAMSAVSCYSKKLPKLQKMSRGA